MAARCQLVEVAGCSALSGRLAEGLEADRQGKAAPLAPARRRRPSAGAAPSVVLSSPPCCSSCRQSSSWGQSPGPEVMVPAGGGGRRSGAQHSPDRASDTSSPACGVRGAAVGLVSACRRFGRAGTGSGVWPSRSLTADCSWQTPLSTRPKTPSWCDGLALPAA